MTKASSQKTLKRTLRKGVTPRPGVMQRCRALRTSGTHADLPLFPTGQTVSSNIPHVVYITATVNAVKNCVSVPVFMTQFACIKNMPLSRSVPLLISLWFLSSVANYWIEWNKIKERLKGEFDLEFLSPNTVFKPGTLYFFNVIGENNALILHYIILNTEKERLEVTSLAQLDSEIQAKLTRGEFDQLTNTDCETLRDSLTTTHKKPLSEHDYTQLKMQLPAHHTPTEKADKSLGGGERIDPWLLWKNFLSIMAPAITTGALIGLLPAKEYPVEVQVFSAATFAALNFLKDLVSESVIAIASHSKATTTYFWNIWPDDTVEKGNIRALDEQLYFNYVLCDFFLGCLKYLAAPVVAISCVSSFAQTLLMLVSLLPKNKPLLSTALSFLVAIASVLLYFPTLSAYRIFTLRSTSKLLESFNIETSLSDYKSKMGCVVDVFPWMLGEVCTGRYLSVDYPLKQHYSPTFITDILIWATNISFISLSYSALVAYLTCSTAGCFDQGEGSLLGLWIATHKLDAAYPVPFIIAMAIAVPVIIVGTSSKKANILEYIEERKKILMTNQASRSGDYQLLEESADVETKSSKDDERSIYLISQDSKDAIVFNDKTQALESMTWLSLKTRIQQEKTVEISAIPFAALFGAGITTGNAAPLAMNLI